MIKEMSNISVPLLKIKCSNTEDKKLKLLSHISAADMICHYAWVKSKPTCNTHGYLIKLTIPYLEQHTICRCLMGPLGQCYPLN